MVEQLGQGVDVRSGDPSAAARSNPPASTESLRNAAWDAPSGRVIAPVDRGPERALALRRVARPGREQRQASAESITQGFRRHDAHPGRGKVDGEGQPIESVDDVGDEAEGIPVHVGGDPDNGFTAAFDAFAADFGLGDGQGLHDFVWIDQWAAIDKNDDLYVCMKDRPITPGKSRVLLQRVDNTAS